MMKVLLAAVNAKYIHSNLAVYSLRAYALWHSPRILPEEIGIVEYTINQPVDEILMDIYEREPDILCFSCYLWNISCVECLIKEIPKILPGIKIWLGGPEVSYNAREILEKYDAVTGVIRGEGEETFVELMDAYHRNSYGHHIETKQAEIKETGIMQADIIQKDIGQADSDLARAGAGHCGAEEGFHRIRGIAWRDRNGAVTETEERPVMDMSTIPFVYEHIEDFRNRIIYYESSRGCPFSCSYCLSSIDKCLRFRDLSLVEKELQFFIDHEVPQVKFVDRTFNCRHDHAMAVWSFIKEHDRGITNFHFEVAADLLNDEEIALIRSMRPGLVQLEIGVQSANEQTIKEIRRTMRLEQVKDKVARIGEKKNVHQHLDLIAGLPYEDYHSFARSFDIVYAMKPEQLQLGFLKVLKGSLMYEKQEEYALVYQDRPPYEVLSTKWLTYADIIRLKRVEDMVEVYYNSGQFRNTMEHLEQDFSSPFAMYEALAAYYEERGLFKVQHSRLARYEILSRFITEYMTASDRETQEITCTDRERAGAGLREYTEWLTLDLYLRDNVKNRPSFLGESGVSKEEAAAFYKAEAQKPRYLEGYEGYDSRQMRKMTHLERINREILLFDYRKRDALTGNAGVFVVEEI